MNMRLVRCISKRQMIPDQLVVGKYYWMDVDTFYTENNNVSVAFDNGIIMPENEGLAEIYLNQDRSEFVGNMMVKHFVFVNRLDKHYNLDYRVVSETCDTFPLIDIVEWCLWHQNFAHNPTAAHLLDHISKARLLEGLSENKDGLYNEYIVKYIPPRSDSNAHNGYYLEHVDYNN